MQVDMIDSLIHWFIDSLHETRARFLSAESKTPGHYTERRAIAADRVSLLLTSLFMLVSYWHISILSVVRFALRKQCMSNKIHKEHWRVRTKRRGAARYTVNTLDLLYKIKHHHQNLAAIVEPAIEKSRVKSQLNKLCSTTEMEEEESQKK